MKTFLDKFDNIRKSQLFPFILLAVAFLTALVGLSVMVVGKVDEHVVFILSFTIKIKFSIFQVKFCFDQRLAGQKRCSIDYVATKTRTSCKDRGLSIITE